MKYIKMGYAALLAAVFAVSDFVIALLDRVPGFPNFLSVDYALKGFEKTRAKLAAAQSVANSRSDRFASLADRYDDMAEAASNEADRAARAMLRLSKLLD